ncbi:hypothetical protein DFS34DRAFT_195740 [Phlyctochytrium arcticum]|nr:hypothetical protein DFS34DRAFT_195740 [Phlyctochytrium arcticum]
MLLRTRFSSVLPGVARLRSDTILAAGQPRGIMTLGHIRRPTSNNVIKTEQTRIFGVMSRICKGPSIDTEELRRNLTLPRTPGQETTALVGEATVHSDMGPADMYWLFLSIPIPKTSRPHPSTSANQKSVNSIYDIISPTDGSAFASNSSADCSYRISHRETCVIPLKAKDRVSDLLMHIQEEYPNLGMPRIHVRPRNQSLLDENTVVDHSSTSAEAGTAHVVQGTTPPLSDMLITDFLRNSDQYTIDLGTRIHLRISKSELTEKLHNAESQMMLLRSELAIFEEQTANIEKAVENRVRLVKYAGMTYITLQLGTIVFLTQQLGWDLMEPVSYLVTIAGMIFSAALYLTIRRDPDYSTMSRWLRGVLRRQIIRWRRFDENKYLQIKRDVERQTTWVKRAGTIL